MGLIAVLIALSCLAGTTRIAQCRPISNEGSLTLDHSRALTYEKIVNGLRLMKHRFGPDLIRFNELGGNPSRPNSDNGRIIHFVELGKGDKVIMVEANIHAREHITSVASLYLIDWALTNYDLPDSQSKQLLDDYRLVVVPLANPDGYMYSLGTDDDLRKYWRNNRHIVENCTGIDLNRNFNFHWEITEQEQFPEFWMNIWDIIKSELECYGGYSGSSAESEPETQAIVNIFNHYKEDMVMYLSVHSFGAKILMPWLYNNTLASPFHKEIGDAMAEAMFKDTAKTVIEAYGYKAKGTSNDWVLNEMLDGTAASNSDFVALTVELDPPITPDSSEEDFQATPELIRTATRHFVLGVLAASEEYARLRN